MTFIKRYCVLFLSVSLLAFSAHKYYISFTKIDYSEKNKALQITMRVFIDDLQNALDDQFRINTELDTKKEIADSDDYISKYISDKFMVKVNGQEIGYNYLGKKYDSDAVKLYIEIENIDQIESIEIQNRVLMELFSDQQNIIKLNINKKKKSFILTDNDDKDLLKF